VCEVRSTTIRAATAQVVDPAIQVRFGLGAGGAVADYFALPEYVSSTLAWGAAYGGFAGFMSDLSDAVCP
jgi:hypothetical protein